MQLTKNEVQCKICFKVLKSRHTRSGSVKFPVYHMRDLRNPCHGFFEEALEIKGDPDGTNR